MKISEGKLKGLEAVADSNGVIRAAAMDQRGSLQKSIAKEKGVDAKQVTRQEMEEFKIIVSKILTPHATSILLDPEFGLPAAKARSKNAGLLLAYESSGYDNTQPGRLPDLLEDCSVRRVKAMGADAIKILIYYSPFDDKRVNEIKHAFVERIGSECADQDIPFFLEFVGYDPKGADVNTPEFAKIKPEVVSKSMEEFTKPQYQVDVLKVEVPINMKFVEGTKSFKGQKVYSRQEAMDYFKKTAKVTTKPFIYLSAGVSDDEFRETLELAAESGVSFNGVLCGRATWKEGIPVYAKQGAKALEEWMKDQGVKNIQALNKTLEKSAKPWYDAYGGKSKVSAVSSKRETASV
jgi:tagatose 1,6-diphosphate aldolase